MTRPTLKVRYTEWPPWAFDIPEGNSTVLDGVLKDVFGALSHSLNYEFLVHTQEDHNFGSLQADGSYSGMLGALHTKEVDVAGPFVASEERAAVAEFTNCLEFSKLGILTGIVSSDRNMFLYAKVFSWQVWFSLLLTIIGISFVVVLIYNLTVRNQNTNQVSLLTRYFWMFWSYLVGHDGGSTNHWAVIEIWGLLSFRILLAAWLLGPVINSLFSFQGSITSTFAVTKLRPVIADLDELTKKTKIVPVTTKGSAVQICFKTSRGHAHIWKRMENNSIKFSEKTLHDTLIKVEKGSHVLIIDYVYALKVASDWVKKTGKCTIQVEELPFCQNFIALALRRGTDPKTMKKINTRLTYIIQAKLTDRWMNRVYTNYTHCTKLPSEGSRPLNIQDILGGFVIWSIGIVISFVALLFEMAQHKATHKPIEVGHSMFKSASRDILEIFERKLASIKMIKN